MGAGMKGACTCLHLGRQAPKKQNKKKSKKVLWGRERGQGGSAGHKAKEKKRRRREADSKDETLSVLHLEQAQQHNIKSCFHKNRHIDIQNGSSLLTFLHINPENMMNI